MRIFYIICVFCITWVQSLSASITLPDFHYSQKSVAVFKAKLHQENTANPFKYVTTGLFFKKGEVRNIDHLSATDLKTEFPLQIKPHNYYDDGSLRLAVVTVYIDKKRENHDIHIVNKPSSYRNMKDIIFQNPLNIQVHITTAQGQKKVFDLRKAKAEKHIWNAGPLLSQKRYHTDLFHGMNIDFDVTQFHTGQYHADIIFHYDRLKKTPMYDINYRADIYVNGKIFKQFKQMTHHHHTRWRYPIYFGYKQDNHALIDMQRVMAVGALPQFDLSLGADLGSIRQDYEQTRQKSHSLYDSGLLTKSMPTTGGRPEIAILPQWAARYVVSGHDLARDVVLKHGEIAAYIPWNFYDADTQRLANILDHPEAWVDYRASLEKHKIAPFKRTSDWHVDMAHQPSLAYLPFIITGDRYHYDTMKAIYMNNRFRTDPYWPEKATEYRAQSYEQIRAYGWFRRAAGEMQSILDVKNDPDAFYIQNANKADLDFLYKKLFLYGIYKPKPDQKLYKEGQHQNIMGALTGSLEGYGNHHSTGKASNFMQDLAALGIGFETGLGFQPWLRQFSAWQSQFIAGRFLQKHNGYAPQYGSAFVMAQFIPDKNGYLTVPGKRIHLFTKWRDVYAQSLKLGFWEKEQKEVSEIGLAGYPHSAASYAAYARASNAQLFNVTRNPDNLEAFGFLAQFIDIAMEGYRTHPSYRISPVFSDGVQLSYKNIEIGASGSNSIKANPYSLVHAGQGNDKIYFDRPHSKGFLFGGEGNDIIDASIGLGSYLYGGDGDDILIASSGHDVLKGDEYYGKGRDNFIFKLPYIGKNVIQDFDPARDRITFCSVQNTPLFQFNFQDMIKTTKKGMVFIDLPQSGHIVLRGIRKDDLNVKNITVRDQCKGLL